MCLLVDRGAFACGEVLEIRGLVEGAIHRTSHQIQCTWLEHPKQGVEHQLKSVAGLQGRFG